MRDAAPSLGTRDLTGRVAVITGAASGIGLACARRLAGQGARIVAIDRSERKLADAFAQWPPDAAPPIALARDLRPPDAGTAVIAEALDRAPRIDILINSAGVCHFRPMKDVSASEWDEVLEVNLRTLFQTSVAMAEAVDPAVGGRIINLGSNAGRKGRALSAHYAASKAAVANLTESLALAYGKKNVTANTVCPAVTDTPMWGNLFSELNAATGKSRDELTGGWRRATPLGRLGTVDDVANLIAFLASDEAAFITGQTINVCGGFMLTC
jgi:NAD(P)-dependent dehydrogenase (short-subunit alcohol dehydrogenase family)